MTMENVKGMVMGINSILNFKLNLKVKNRLHL